MANPKTFSDYLNWGALIEPGVVACKDGSFLAGWSVRGLDTESIEPEVLEAQLKQLARGVGGFADQDAFWVSIRRGTFGGVEQEPTRNLRTALQLMETERAAILNCEGTLFSNAITLVFQYTPQSLNQPVAMGLNEFQNRCRMVQNRVGRVLTLTRLGEQTHHDLDGAEHKYDDLTAFLAQSASGQHRRIRIPKHVEHMYLDVFFKVGFSQPSLNEPAYINEKPFVIISIDGYPKKAPREALSGLEQLDYEYQWTTRYVCFSKNSTRKKTKSIRKSWRQSASSVSAQMANGGGGDRDAHADHMAHNVDDVSLEIGGGEVGHGSYSSTITLFGGHGDTLGDLVTGAEAIVETLLEAGFEARVERQNAFEAFLGSLPGHKHRNPRDVILSSQNFADLIPIRTIWEGERFNPSDKFPSKTPALLQGRAASGEIYNLNLHHGDVGHTLIFGPTTAGKSVLLGLLAANFMKYQGAQVIAFDKGRSMQFATYAMEGKFTSFGGIGAQGIAPLNHLKSLGVEWGYNWLKEMARLNGMTLDPRLTDEIHRTVSMIIDTENPSLESIRDFIQHPEFSAVLNRYKDTVLNNKDEDLTWSDFTVFETHELLEAKDDIAILALDYLFARVEQRLDGRPTLLILDEAWSYLEHEVFVERIRFWIKEKRKDNVAVVLATQSVADAVDSKITPVLLDNCFTKIFLPNVAAKTEKPKAQYKTLGLNDAQIDLISQITPKKDYYVVQPNGQRVVDFILGPIALSILGRTDKKDSTRAGQKYAENPHFWLDDVQSDIRKNFMEA